MEDLDAVYREHAKTVYCYLLSKCGSKEIAEELTQETFFQAVKTIHRYDGSCRITTWLCGIAKNLWLAQHRKDRNAALPLEEAPEQTEASAETQYFEKAENEQILQAIHRMPEPSRELLHLRLLGGLSFRQIGQIMGQTETWARVTYYRAKTKLVKELNEK